MIRHPGTLDEFIGNDDITEVIKIHLYQAEKNNERMRHLGFFGPPGHGKTVLSKIISNHWGSEYLYFNSTSISSPATIGYELDELKVVSNGTAKALIMFDEAHTIPPRVQTSLLSLIEYPTIFTWEEKKQVIRQSYDGKITVIFATTKPTKLIKPLRDRLVECYFREYTNEEKVRITEKELSYRHINLSSDMVELIAYIGRSPRIIKKMLDNLSSLRGYYSGESWVTILRKAIKISGYDPMTGLSHREKDYIKVLNEFRTASLQQMADALMTDVEDVTDNIEPFLSKNGLLIKSPGVGRTLSTTGRKIIEENANK